MVDVPPAATEPDDASAKPRFSGGDARTHDGDSSRAYGPALALLTLLFFMWGFITVLNDILIPHLKGVFDLSNAHAMLVQSAFFGAYFVASLPAGRLVARVGYQRGIVVGLAVAGLGAAMFYPASHWLSYPLFLLALFVLATGITILQVAANPYVTVLGPPRTAASRLNLTQGINSLGTTLAPIAGTWMILDAGTTPAAQRAAAVQLPYLGIATTLAALAVVFARVRLPRLAGEQNAGTGRNVLAHRPLRLGIAGIFLYVGAEVTLGSVIVMFLGQPHIAGLAEDQAGFYVALYWGATMVGRFVGSALQQRFAPQAVLRVAAAAACVLVAVAAFGRGQPAMWALLTVGLTNSVMFPTIFSMSIAGLGRDTSRAAGLLVMAIVGGAVVPFVVGRLIDDLGLAIGIASTIACYAYIVYFARSVASSPR